MRILLTQISEAIRNVVKVLFASDIDVMSDEVRQILSNPEDAKKYKDAVRQIEEDTTHSVTITLSNNKQLTLIQ